MNKIDLNLKIFKNNLKIKFFSLFDLQNNISDEFSYYSVAIGNFDGVHLGHKSVINYCITKSKKKYKKSNNHYIKSVVITFLPHPNEFKSNFHREYKNIISLSEKIIFIAKLGIDEIWFLDFNEELANTRAKDFIKILISNRVISITTGENFCFGKNKSGNSVFLKKYIDQYNQYNQTTYNIEYHSIPCIKINNNIISSSKIKEYIKYGDIKTVNKFLGRKYNFYLDYLSRNPNYKDYFINIGYVLLKKKIFFQIKYCRCKISIDLIKLFYKFIKLYEITPIKNINSKKYKIYFILFIKKLKKLKLFLLTKNFRLIIDKNALVKIESKNIEYSNKSIQIYINNNTFKIIHSFIRKITYYLFSIFHIKLNIYKENIIPINFELISVNL
ncbi:FAD synthetase family protein [Lyticum sinuosum]|uniref:FAD synthase n=1 Tax=Lyticum sinuosum TaxID=1332059 RepID=A0AAE4VKP0_9RICK|nr:FAD synthetase family protein [Lyticum sinuosum]MDZ5761168.1 Riboflavin biosynthesis protein RibF [Lyticum sinuosum]